MFEVESQKSCCRCGQLKPEAQFNYKNRAVGRLHPFCRECQHAWNRAHYLKNRATYIAHARRNAALYVAENTRRLVAYLLLHPCVECGEADPLVLQFDHRDRTVKRIEISCMLKDYSWSAIEIEISKCDVRCANCHSRRTARQFGFRKLALVLEKQGRQGSNLQTFRFGDGRSSN